MEKIKAKYFDLKQFVKLMQFVKPYNKSFYLVMFFAVLLSVITTVTPYLLKVVVDDYIIPKDYSGMTLIILLMIIALTVEVLFMLNPVPKAIPNCIFLSKASCALMLAKKVKPIKDSTIFFMFLYLINNVKLN